MKQKSLVDMMMIIGGGGDWIYYLAVNIENSVSPLYNSNCINNDRILC